MSVAERTYATIVELERAGMSRSAAFRQIAEREGANVAAISARYYAAQPPEAKKLHRRPRRRDEIPAPATNGEVATIPDMDVSQILETLATVVRDLAGKIAEVERDAIRWRQVAAMIGDD